MHSALNLNPLKYMLYRINPHQMMHKCIIEGFDDPSAVTLLLLNSFYCVNGLGLMNHIANNSGYSFLGALWLQSTPAPAFYKATLSAPSPCQAEEEWAGENVLELNR